MRSHEIHWELRELYTVLNREVCDASSCMDSRGWPGKVQEPLRFAILVVVATGVINNGGFSYFFENDWPSRVTYRQFEEAYRAIGAIKAADLLVQATAFFPFKHPEKDCDRRRAIIEAQEVGEEESPMDCLGTEMIDIGGEVVAQLVDYCMRHGALFPALVARKAEFDHDKGSTSNKK